MSKASQYREMESAELLGKLEEKREELFRLRLSFSSGSLENPKQIRQVRHEIARMMTVLRERELALEIARQETVPGEGEETPNAE